MSQMGPESLHTHTTQSDGKLSPQELWDAAKNIGLSVLAYTDHDALPSEETLEFLEGKRGDDMKWIIGTEITCAIPGASKKNSHSKMHLLGLFLDPANEQVRGHANKTKLAREERMRSVVRALQELGFEISDYDCVAEARGHSIGRPHIASALVKKEHNLELLHRLAFQLKKDAVGDEKLDVLYKDTLVQVKKYGPVGYVYNLFLGDRAYIRTLPLGYSYFPTFQEAVAMVRGAGGVASFAHYHRNSKGVSFEELEQLIDENEIDAIETYNSHWDLRFRGSPMEGECTRVHKQLLTLAEEKGVLKTGGSDAHTEEELRQFVQEHEYAEGSKGLSKKILLSGRVNVAYSSL